MYNLSKYTRVFYDIDPDIIVYNTINKAIVSFPRERLVEGKNLVFEPEELVYLKENNFLEGYEDTRRIIKRYEQFETLIISLEISLKCNLACPYCYQIGNTSTKHISYEELKQLSDYIKSVYSYAKYKTLVLKILGGEPSLDWYLVENTILELFNFCEKNDIVLKLMIDTNGTIIDRFLNLKYYHQITFTIPLTEAECHDRYRTYRSGRGTYKDIITNTNILHKTLQNCTIVLRYNIDNQNIQAFEKYINDLVNVLEYIPIISPNYTMNIGGGHFNNTLDHQELVRWRSSFFIDILALHDLPIVVTPYTIGAKCQYWSPYSLKMFSDGSVGACAMSFWDKNRPHISQFVADIGASKRLWSYAKEYNLFADKKCRNCQSLFLCGGTYNLPCNKAINERKCHNKDSLHIDLKLFLSRYLKYLKEGKAELFVGFNNNNIYR